MMNESVLRSHLENLFREQRLAVLSTHNGGQPYSSLVAFSASRDLTCMYFATTRATRKYANLQRDGRVSLLVDNRSNAASDFREAMAVTITGRARDMEESEKAIVKKDYLAKHPYLDEFIASPTCAFIEVEVETYYAVHRFQSVVELHMKP
jgi:nitroimidazol reductase NimA-like FMN-containing flavoprotein (pyridoxamine 5'-phosphate oxidase superfamily)